MSDPLNTIFILSIIFREPQQHNFDLTNFYTNHVVIRKSNMAPKSNKNDKCHDCGKDVITNEKALSCSICVKTGTI